MPGPFCWQIAPVASAPGVAVVLACFAEASGSFPRFSTVCRANSLYVICMLYACIVWSQIAQNPSVKNGSKLENFISPQPADVPAGLGP